MLTSSTGGTLSRRDRRRDILLISRGAGAWLHVVVVGAPKAVAAVVEIATPASVRLIPLTEIAVGADGDAKELALAQAGARGVARRVRPQGIRIQFFGLLGGISGAFRRDAGHARLEGGLFTFDFLYLAGGGGPVLPTGSRDSRRGQEDESQQPLRPGTSHYMIERSFFLYD